MDGRIFHIRKKLAANLDHDWTIEEMARAVELSEPHFQKLFKANTGMSPMTFLRELRLTRACETLQSTFRRLKQIRLEIGMPDDSHFSRDFKRRFGITPSEYRRRHWESVQCETGYGAES